MPPAIGIHALDCSYLNLCKKPSVFIKYGIEFGLNLVSNAV